MMRLSTPDYKRFEQSNSFDVTYGGGEANVAAAICNYGLQGVFVTKVPKDALGQSAINHLRRYEDRLLRSERVRRRPVRALPELGQHSGFDLLSAAEGEPGVEEVQPQFPGLDLLGEEFLQFEVRLLRQPDRVPDDRRTSAVRQRLPQRLGQTAFVQPAESDRLSPGRPRRVSRSLSCQRNRGPPRWSRADTACLLAPATRFRRTPGAASTVCPAAGWR